MTNILDIEEAFIGSILIDPTLADLVDIRPDQFKNARLGKVWNEIISLTQKGEAADYLILSKRLGIEESYLLGLITKTPSALNYDTYAGQIIEDYTKRKMMEFAHRLANSDGRPADETISEVVVGLSTIQNSREGARPIKEFIPKLYDEIADLKKSPRDYYGIRTGVRDFDKITYGLQRKEVFILAGEPGVGKSIFAIQLALGMEKEVPGVIYELEMTADAIIRRSLSADSRIPVWQLRTGRFEDDRWDDFMKAVARLENSRIFLSDGTKWTTSAIRADIARLKSRGEIGWVIIDYLNLLADRYGRDNNERTTYISKQLHNIAKDLDVAILAINSMNKQGMSGEPGMEHISGSGSIAYDADSICFMMKTKDPDVFQLVWDKVREGDSNRMMKIVRVRGFPAFAGYAGQPY